MPENNMIVRVAHRRQGYRFENDWTVEELKEGIGKERIKSGVAIPVNIEIEAEQRVLDLERVKEYLGQADPMALLDCGCRTARHNCDAPVDVCIVLNDTAERALSDEEFRKRNPRKVTMAGALDALARSHEAGLVHMAYDTEQGMNIICSCCSCCCGVLSGVLRFGLAPHVLTSDTVSVMDTSKCDSCGVCVKRCQFGAREIVDGSIVFKPELCFGCGLCVSSCPTGAIKLVDK